MRAGNLLAFLGLVTVGLACGSHDDGRISAARKAIVVGPGGPAVCADGDCEVVVGEPITMQPGPPSTGGGPPPAILVAEEEIPCNGIDEDLDGYDFCLGDADGDGMPAPLDCDDLDPDVSPLADEIACDGLDQNCDGFDSCDSDLDGVDDRFDCDPNDSLITDQCLLPPSPPGPTRRMD